MNARKLLRRRSRPFPQLENPPWVHVHVHLRERGNSEHSPDHKSLTLRWRARQAPTFRKRALMNSMKLPLSKLHDTSSASPLTPRTLPICFRRAMAQAASSGRDASHTSCQCSMNARVRAVALLCLTRQGDMEREKERE